MSITITAGELTAQAFIDQLQRFRSDEEQRNRQREHYMKRNDQQTHKAELSGSTRSNAVFAPAKIIFSAAPL